MARLCERPACSEPAAVVYRFDADARHVWLETPGGDDRSAGVLCTAHADALRVPLGWTLDDRRETVPRLFVPDEDTSDLGGMLDAAGELLARAFRGTERKRG